MAWIEHITSDGWLRRFGRDERCGARREVHRSFSRGTPAAGWPGEGSLTSEERSAGRKLIDLAASKGHSRGRLCYEDIHSRGRLCYEDSHSRGQMSVPRGKPVMKPSWPCAERCADVRMGCAHGPSVARRARPHPQRFGGQHDARIRPRSKSLPTVPNRSVSFRLVPFRSVSFPMVPWSSAWFRFATRGFGPGDGQDVVAALRCASHGTRLPQRRESGAKSLVRMTTCVLI